jgi:hypothetical protein
LRCARQHHAPIALAVHDDLDDGGVVHPWQFGFVFLETFEGRFKAALGRDLVLEVTTSKFGRNENQTGTRRHEDQNSIFAVCSPASMTHPPL